MAYQIEGIKVAIGGVEYTMPPLSFQSVRAFSSTIKKLEKIAFATDQKDPELDSSSVDILEFIPLVHAALLRNYPDLALETIENALGFECKRDGRFLTMVLALWGISMEDCKAVLEDTLKKKAESQSPSTSTGTESTG